MTEPIVAHSTSTTAQRRALKALILLVPWCMWLITRWTMTPVAAIDAWIYRGLSQNLPAAQIMFPKFYYASRLFVLVPSYLLHAALPQGIAHAAFSFGLLYLFLFAMDDFTSHWATWRTRIFLVLFAAACPYLLRTEGWGYIDGFVITVFAVSLAALARSLHSTGNKSHFYSGLSGAAFFSMCVTHPMAVVLGFCLLWFYVVHLFSTRKFLAAQTLWRMGWFVMGGVLTILSMCVISQIWFGHFVFFQPIIDAALHVAKTSDTWKKPMEIWLPRADWLAVPLFAWLSALTMMTLALFRIRLTRFEWFAYPNAAILLTAIALLDYRGGFWLQYSFYASYFLPVGLVAIAALLGESNPRPFQLKTIAGMALLVLALAVGVHIAQRPFIQGLAYPPSNLDGPPAHILNFFKVQRLAIGLAIFLILLHRFALRRGFPETRWLLPAICASGMAVLAGVSHYAIPEGPDIQTSRNIAGVTQMIQHELGAVRPLFWYDDNSPLTWQFVSVNSAYLSGYSGISRNFPNLAYPARPEWRSVSDSSSEPWLGGEQLVILTEFPDRMPHAIQSFRDLGLDLKESHRVYNPHGYWIIFAKTVNAPIERHFFPPQLGTTLKNSKLLDPGPNGHPLRSTSGEEGFLAYGPYTQLSAGKYTVSYLLKIQGATTTGNILTLDAMADLPTSMIIASRPIGRADLLGGGFQRYTLDFETDHAMMNVQFRAFTTGTQSVTLDSVTISPR